MLIKLLLASALLLLGACATQPVTGQASLAVENPNPSGSY